MVIALHKPGRPLGSLATILDFFTICNNDDICTSSAKQKQPGCKTSARPIRSKWSQETKTFDIR